MGSLEASLPPLLCAPPHDQQGGQLLLPQHQQQKTAQEHFYDDPASTEAEAAVGLGVPLAEGHAAARAVLMALEKEKEGGSGDDGGSRSDAAAAAAAAEGTAASGGDGDGIMALPCDIPSLEKLQRGVETELSAQVLKRTPQFSSLWSSVSAVGNDLTRLRVIAANSRRALGQARTNLVLVDENHNKRDFGGAPGPALQISTTGGADGATGTATGSSSAGDAGRPSASTGAAGARGGGRLVLSALSRRQEVLKQCSKLLQEIGDVADQVSAARRALTGETEEEAARAGRRTPQTSIDFVAAFAAVKEARRLIRAAEESAEEANARRIAYEAAELQKMRQKEEEEEEQAASAAANGGGADALSQQEADKAGVNNGTAAEGKRKRDRGKKKRASISGAAPAKLACLRSLASELKDIEQQVITKLEANLSATCRSFESVAFGRILNAFMLLKGRAPKKSSSADDKAANAAGTSLSNHILVVGKIERSLLDSVADNTRNVLYAHVLLSERNAARPEVLRKKKFQDLCAKLGEEHFFTCLSSVLEVITDVLFVHYSMEQWLLDALEADEAKSGAAAAGSSPDPAKRQFLAAVLSGLRKFRTQLWGDIQRKVAIILTASNMTSFSVDEFLNTLNCVNRLLAVGRQFLRLSDDPLSRSALEPADPEVEHGDRQFSKNLRLAITKQSKAVFEKFHSAKVEDLKTMLEHERWEPCPVGPDFGMADMTEFAGALRVLRRLRHDAGHHGTPTADRAKVPESGLRPSGADVQSHYLSKTHPNGVFADFRGSAASSPSEGALSKVRNIGGNPFSQQYIQALADAEARKAEKNAQELARLHVERKQAVAGDADSSRHPASSLLTTTTINVMRLIGKYINMMQVLDPIAEDVFSLGITQLFEFYFLTIFSFFQYKDMVQGSASSSSGSSIIVPDHGLVSGQLRATLSQLVNQFAPEFAAAAAAAKAAAESSSAQAERRPAATAKSSSARKPTVGVEAGRSRTDSSSSNKPKPPASPKKVETAQSSSSFFGSSPFKNLKQNMSLKGLMSSNPDTASTAGPKPDTNIRTSAGRNASNPGNPPRGSDAKSDAAAKKPTTAAPESSSSATHRRTGSSSSVARAASAASVSRRRRQGVARGRELTIVVPTVPDVSSTLESALHDPKTLYGARLWAVALSSIEALARIMTELKPVLLSVLGCIDANGEELPEAAKTAARVHSFFARDIDVVDEFVAFKYGGLVRKFFGGWKTTTQLIEGVKFDTRELGVEHSPYVDQLIKEFSLFANRVNQAAAGSADPGEFPGMPDLHKARMWRHAVRQMAVVLADGYAGVKKCSGEGRALMSLDLNMLRSSLDPLFAGIADVMSPPPNARARDGSSGDATVAEDEPATLADFAAERFEFVDTFIKAYYLPQEEVIVWCRKHPEYSLEQWHSIVNQGAGAQMKKRDRLGLLTVLDELYKQVEAQRLHQRKIEEARAAELAKQSEVEAAQAAVEEKKDLAEPQTVGDPPAELGQGGSEEVSGETEPSARSADPQSEGKVEEHGHTNGKTAGDDSGQQPEQVIDATDSASERVDAEGDESLA